MSEGGLFTTLLESAMPGGLGFEVSVDLPVRRDACWFGESQSRVVVSLPADAYPALADAVASTGTPLLKIGTVTAGEIRIDGADWGRVEGWKGRYDTAIESYLHGYQSE